MTAPSFDQGKKLLHLGENGPTVRVGVSGPKFYSDDER